MVALPDKYITLMASMPALQNPLQARELPLSRLRLDNRLRLLDDADGELLRRIERVMEWERVRMADSDADVIAELNALMRSLPSPRLRTVVRDRFERRTLLAAMRRRRRGEAAPPDREPWGYGRYVHQIRRNWSRPHFGLRRTMPWLAELREMHDAGDTLELDRSMLRLDWSNLVDARASHEFDFEAVVLYVLRFNRIARWLGHSVPGARARFDELVAIGLGDFAALAPEGR